MTHQRSNKTHNIQLNNLKLLKFFCLIPSHQIKLTHHRPEKTTIFNEKESFFQAWETKSYDFRSKNPSNGWKNRKQIKI